MKKRSTKKRIKKIIFFAVLSVAVFSISGILILFLRDISFSSINFSPRKNSEIINPNATYSVSDIRNGLAGVKLDYSRVIVSSSSGSLRADLIDGSQVYFSYEKDIEWQISSLQSIIRRLTIENKLPAVIDLRYNRPIVKFLK